MISLLPPSGQYDPGNEGETRRQIEQALQAVSPSSGLYTPVVSSSGGGETVTYSNQAGLYVRQGALLWVSIDLTLATKSGGSGDIQVSLPTVARTGPTQPLSLQIDNMAAGWTGAPLASIQSGAALCRVREWTGGTVAQAWTKLGATGSIRLTGWYLPAR